MAQRLFNTLTNRKEELVPVEPGRIGMYVCGPTVYDMSHLGHARAYVAFDTIARWLRASGYEVELVRNYTDVDDKIIRRAQETGAEPREIAERYIAEFRRDMDALNVRPGDVEPKVTEHMAEIVSMIETLVANGVAYEADGDVYFAVRKFPDYGKLSKRKLEDLMAGARVEPGEKKKDPLDFALWKAAKPGEPAWDSPWGKGRPGWHIECSAMSARYLGKTFDIHGGGKDLVFPHHENEIAQSEAAHHQPFAKYWLHNGFVTIQAEKMAKSLGNFVTIRDLLARYDGEALRYFLLSTHYRSPIDFSPEGLDAAQARVAYVYETLRRADERLEGHAPQGGEVLYPEVVEGFEARFREAMEDDFNTAAALAAVGEAFPVINELIDRPPTKDRAKVRETLARLVQGVRRMAEVLGVFGQEPGAWLERHRQRLCAQKGIDPAEVEAKIDARARARAEKNWAEADRIRDELAAMGVEIMDTPRGTTWRVQG
ncbi:MAG TPA: cysteine--tRNA ligase [Fredinandcohnia sp.]|nr:cysteine--tRNA ligase [Fredinandcohnia sp.]